MSERFFADMELMNADHLAGPEVFHASVFWRKLNDLNVEWLRSDGIERFKETINNNYFNWMVGFRSVYFRNVLRDYLRRHRNSPLDLLRPLAPGLPAMRCRTLTSAVPERFGYVYRKLYAAYVYMLCDLARSQDGDMFATLEEPKVGNPICVRFDGRDLSQDLCNSFLEHQYMRRTLGAGFAGVRNVLEIGSGYGRLAYVFRHVARREMRPLRLILVDLPVALSVAQWYLPKVFPDARMFRYRPFASFDDVRAEFEGSDICFLLPHQMALLPDRYVDLLINISSFQEMSIRQIRAYYRLIDAKASYFYTKQWMFWTNPDDNMPVPALVYPTRDYWNMLDFRLNPVHTEFFEALFQVCPPGGAGDTRGIAP